MYIIIATHIACTKSPVERKLDNPKNKKEKFFSDLTEIRKREKKQEKRVS